MIDRKTIFIAIAILFILIAMKFISNGSIFDNDFSHVVVDRNGRNLRIFLDESDSWHIESVDSKIPPRLITCVLFFEDRRFFSHFGVDPFAVIRAAYQNVLAGEIVSGASTIPMQIARLSGNRPRTLGSKLFEMLIALQLEASTPKIDILKTYLDNAPYGGNIVGYRSASLRYWKKKPKKLTWAEAATLAVLPNNPSWIRPGYADQRLLQRRNLLLERLNRMGIIDQETLRLAKLESIPTGQFPFEMHAPHLTRRVLSESNEQIIKTTIDKDVQIYVERIVDDYCQIIRKVGIGNVSVLVADTPSREILAYIGSADFFDRYHDGMVDGVVAPRSYGSLLKPFLYALAIEDGLLLPASKLIDVPTYYGAFSPENFDRDYRGLVPAHDALVMSLNVPAVRLLSRYGVYEFHSFLQSTGLEHINRPHDDYGLSLILGGGEATLLELTTLYCALGNMGEIRKLRYLKSDTDTTSKRILDYASSRLIVESLRDVRRPGIEAHWSLYEDARPIAWKTGTSFGHRDAWACGVSPELTIGVWVGNFDGSENSNLVGTDIAGPLLFRIFNELSHDRSASWFQFDSTEFRSISLCRQSGYRCGEFCADTIIVHQPKNVENLHQCMWHRRLYTTLDTTEQVCSLCWDRDNLTSTAMLCYPPSVAAYLISQGMSYTPPPPHRLGCLSTDGESPLEIIYPPPDANLAVPKSIDGNFERPIFKAAHTRTDAMLFWHIDGDFVGSTIIAGAMNEHSIEVDVESGSHRLVIVDDAGNSIVRNFFVTKKDRDR